jgi:uncharacterized protein YuzE
MTYDGEGDTLSMLLSKGRIVRAEENGPVVTNFDRKGKVVEIEILSASNVLGGFLSALIKAKPGSRMVQVTA